MDVIMKQAPAPKKRGRGKYKRMVIDDSDEDDDNKEPKKATPQKAAPRKRVRNESPKGEATTTSDYFATNGKSKPSRSAPSKKAKPAKSVPEAPKATPTRASTRKSDVKTYTEENFLDDDDDDDADDIFQAEFQKPGEGPDAYVESDEEEEDVIPVRKPSSKQKLALHSKKKEKKTLSEEEDINMKEVDPDENLIVPDDDEEFVDEKPKPSTASRKRKSKVVDEDDEDDPAPKKAKSTKSPRKPRAKKEEQPESKELQDIFNSIPTVRPPTPPPTSGEPKKWQFGKQQEAPPAAGSKDLPVGEENCLQGLAFVFTGVLESLERDKGQELVKRYGGKVTTAPSSKTSYVVLGNDAGPRKLETIKKHNLKTINEDGLFELIRRLPANGGDGKAAEKIKEKKEKEGEKIRQMAKEIDKEEKRSKQAGESSNGGPPAQASVGPEVESRLWTTKYAPSNMNMIVGNKAQVTKLQTWLRGWHESARKKFKLAGKEGFGVFRAVMIHGPPGIGKTTAAHLVAKLEGFDVLEMNASDTRNKKLLQESLGDVLDTTSIRGYFAGDGKVVESENKKLVLIMDEVDGMSGGDRGGVGTLAAIAKKTQIPMILICNERRSPKMRPFDGITFDMPFRRPTTEQIRSRMMTICYREGMKIPPPALDALIEGTHADLRQCVNMLSTVKLDQEAMSFDKGKEMSKAWQKHVILKPWDIVTKILGGHMFAPNSTASLSDKTELYFNDFEFAPLMLQENYLKASPIRANTYSGKERQLKLLELIDNAAESISDGDLVDRMIHGSQQQWTLMNEHSIFGFVRPASFMAGSLAGGGRTEFTAWLGNNSKQTKLMRLIKEVQGHMRLRSSADRHAIRQEYLPLLWHQLVKELQILGQDQIPEIIELMDSYYLTKDDWDAIIELGVGPMAEDKVKIDAKVRGAFTRKYNQQTHPLPFMKASSVADPKKVSKERPDLDEAFEESDEEVVESEAEEITDPEEKKKKEEEARAQELKKDKYVKAAKSKPAKKADTKGGGKKKGKGKGKANDEEDMDDDEEVKPKKGRGRPKGKGKK
ncbi:MAG: hypothetical protein M1834_003294 [Cirrosporium novae-zelandiae]|nr:MAG: hypothetical protein M1834_003294 [Cirrosporium novae-zelandiae]